MTDSFPPLKNVKNAPWWIIVLLLLGGGTGGGYSLLNDIVSVKTDIRDNTEAVASIKEEMKTLKTEVRSCAETMSTIVANQAELLSTIQELNSRIK